MRGLRMYRLVVLPVVDTWMSWSLLRKLAWAPGAGTILLLGVLVTLFIMLGLQVWHHRLGILAHVSSFGPKLYYYVRN